MHASAPRCTSGQSRAYRGDEGTHVVWRRNLALVYWHNCAGHLCHFTVVVGMVDAHDSRPTPNPEMNLPKTMLGIPPVKVWMAPPMVKTTAPLNRVPLRPIASPMRPAASEVTVEHQKEMRGLWFASGFFMRRTERADFQHRDHQAQFSRMRVVEVFLEIRTGDDAGHDTERIG